ncbi:MAG: hypothetical protein QF578_13545 [Alphaproteobacteria bacterium]|nr:hypothetical protein [Alphaproteobacteria bacterium]MDP6814023.1 hypothetical protein [Alphaproteobacteria bacterium]
MVRERARQEVVSALRRRVAAIERGGGDRTVVPPLTLGAPEIDGNLPHGGLARGALHEVLGGPAEGGGAAPGTALAFIAALAARAAADGGCVLWCLSRRGLYGPGLAAFGLASERLILVRGANDGERLWAMEEGLKCPRLAAVVGEVGRLDLGQSRRLQLAAEGHGVTALLLRPGAAGAVASAALTRWRIAAAPSAPTLGYAGVGAARFDVELLRCKGGRPGHWLLQWNEADDEPDDGQGGTQAGAFAVAAALADGPAVPGLAAARG